MREFTYDLFIPGEASCFKNLFRIKIGRDEDIRTERSVIVTIRTGAVIYSG